MSYTHPEPMIVSDLYIMEVTTGGGGINKSIPRAQVNNEVKLADVRTLPISDLIKDRALTLRMITKAGVEISKTTLDITTICFAKPNTIIEFKTQKLNIEGKPELKGTLHFRLKYVDGNAVPVQPAAQAKPSGGAALPKEEEKSVPPQVQ